MTIASENAKPIQNIGFVDRIIRFVIGAGLIWSVVLYYGMEHPMLNVFAQVMAVIVALYPLWTCNVGWDPIYALFGINSGSDSGRNQCGTFPYQIKAAAGRAPKYCDIHDERSLEACHEGREQRPLHQVWQVDREPIMYPDRETLDEYFRNHPAPPATEQEAGEGNESRPAVRKGNRDRRSRVKAA